MSLRYIIHCSKCDIIHEYFTNMHHLYGTTAPQIQMCSVQMRLHFGQAHERNFHYAITSAKNAFYDRRHSQVTANYQMSISSSLSLNNLRDITAISLRPVVKSTGIIFLLSSSASAWLLLRLDVARSYGCASCTSRIPTEFLRGRTYLRETRKSSCELHKHYKWTSRSRARPQLI